MRNKLISRVVHVQAGKDFNIEKISIFTKQRFCCWQSLNLSSLTFRSTETKIKAMNGNTKTLTLQQQKNAHWEIELRQKMDSISQSSLQQPDYENIPATLHLA
jgi:hypothetical protein